MSEEMKSIALNRVAESLFGDAVENYIVVGSLKVNYIPFEEFVRSLELDTANPGEKNVRN